MPVTIKEIARRLEINPSTVSRALAGKADVSEITRQRVIDMATQLNYTPNLWAQNLVGTISNWIGCLVLDLSNPFYIPLLRALEDKAEKSGYIILLGESRRQLETEKMLIERFRRIKAAGVVVSPVLADLSHLQVLQKENVPVVIVGRTVAGFDCVNADNTRSGELVGQYLASRGHNRIGFIYSGDPFNTPEKERLQGLQTAFCEYHAAPISEFIVGNNEIKGGELGAQKWLDDPDRPGAVFCSNDMLAMGFISRVIEAGVSVPNDVSVIGHDDVPFAGNFTIPLTTVSMHTDQMGQKAMETLLSRLRAGDCCDIPLSILLEPELVVRKSSN